MRNFLRDRFPLAAVAAMFFTLIFATASFAGFDDQFTESNDIGENKIPHVGLSHVLIIPVIVKGGPKIDMDRWNAFFENKLDAFTFRNFWSVNSLGRYDVQVTFIEPITYDSCPLPKEFKDCAIKRGDTNALKPGIKILTEILSRARDDRGVRFRDFDVNGPDEAPDGWDDGILVLSNMDFGGIAFPLSLFKRTSIDGVKIGGVAVACLKDDEVVALHEFGHLLGFGDLYHENERNRGLHLSLMGEYTKSPPLLDAYSRMKIGWADVVQPGPGDHSVRLAAAETTGRVIRVGGPKEFFLIENRRPGKFFDRNLSRPGLAIYHIDENKLPRPGRFAFIQLLQHCLNCDTWHPLIMNVPPDGLFAVQFGLKPKNDSLLFRTGDSFLPDYSSQNPPSVDEHPLNSNWYSGEPSDIAIHNIDSDGHLPAITFELSVK